MEAGGAVRSIDGVARRGLTGAEGVVVVGLCHRGGWPASASGSGISVVGAEEGSGAHNSSRRRRGSSLVRTKGRGENRRRGCGGFEPDDDSYHIGEVGRQASRVSNAHVKKSHFYLKLMALFCYSFNAKFFCEKLYQLRKIW